MGCTNIRVASVILERALNFPEGVEILGIEPSILMDGTYVFTIAGDAVPNMPECRAVIRTHPVAVFEPVTE